MTDTRDEALYEGPCVPGCEVFHGGETRHHPDCGHYPESLSKVNNDRIAALEEQVARLKGENAEARDRALVEAARAAEDIAAHGAFNGGYNDGAARARNAVLALRSRPSPAPSEAVREGKDLTAAAGMALMYLDTGFVSCGRCGNEIDTKDTDAADELRRALASEGERDG